MHCTIALDIKSAGSSTQLTGLQSTVEVITFHVANIRASE